MYIDYAKAENAGLWLRQPVLGDPSFDTFEKLGNTIHKSQPPFEWAVNVSLFRDPKDGAWYCYGGLYRYNYAKSKEHVSHFIIYKSTDEGKSWECLGPGIKDSIVFEHLEFKSANCPDVVITYDEQNDIYWLAYDWSTENWTWEHANKQNNDMRADSGSALAWAKSPAGPFHRLPSPLFSNNKHFGKTGFLTRGYATTLIKRKNDWIAFVLFDSAQYYSWGLACLTASTPEGPWSEPTVLLSVERPEYYPAPVEFYPCFTVDDKVYAPATSVCANRNYQAIFSAKLEKAHIASAWSLEYDGNVWHSRYDSDEKYGIWGQTIHGFVHNGRFVVVYPAKDERDYGTLSVAERPWDLPISDGFTFSGHAGESVSPTLSAYKDFELTAVLKVHGNIDIAFDYNGVLGPDRSAANCSPHKKALCSYSAVRISEKTIALVTIDHKGNLNTYFESATDSQNVCIKLVYKNNSATLYLKDKEIGTATIECDRPRPLALVADKFSMISCDKFVVEGDCFPYTLKYNCYDAMLGAGQDINDWERIQSEDFCIGEGFIGRGNVRAKWNIIGNGFSIYSPRSPELGVMSVWIDGYFYNTVDLYNQIYIDSSPVFAIDNLEQGRHSVVIKPYKGAVAIDCIEVRGIRVE